MKKQRLILLLLLLVGVVETYAQSTFNLPYRGATHTYSATVTDGGAPNPVRWYVATDAEGKFKASEGTDYTFITPGYNAANQQLEGSAVYSVQLTWGTTIAVNSTYYVFIEVDDDVTNCSNRMALPVTVTADFNALAYNVTGSATPGTIVPGAGSDIITETCPDDVVNPIWNGVGHTDIGTTEMVFRVQREHSLLAWQFGYNITEATSQAFTVTNVRMVNESGAQIYNAANAAATITGIASNQNYVLVYVKVANQQNINLAINLNLVSATTHDSDNNIDSSVADNLATHTIRSMPAITGFSGN